MCRAGSLSAGCSISIRSIDPGLPFSLDQHPSSDDQPMTQSALQPSSRQDEGFEFELTDLEEARRILDGESVSQFEVARLMPAEHWEKRRRGKLATDRALTGVAIDWLLSLPPTLRPQHLARQFPRISNALSEVWHEPEQLRAAFDRLLCDRRIGRRGFPAAVRDELLALQRWTQIS